MPRQFDIVENRNPRSRRDYPFVVILQSDRAEALNSLIVAPLVEAGGGFERSRIHPAIELAGVRYVLLCERMAAVEGKALGRPVGSAQERRYEINAAIDMLFTGI